MSIETALHHAVDLFGKQAVAGFDFVDGWFCGSFTKRYFSGFGPAEAVEIMILDTVEQ